jgi:NhaA family Na+:H+ antiporter
MLSCFILVKLKWCELPVRTTWIQMLGIGLLAGIGFTMSIFISMLAFDDAQFQDISKIGVLLGSFLSAVFGYICLLAFSKKLTRPV